MSSASEDESSMSGKGSAPPRLLAVPTPIVRSRHSSVIRVLGIVVQPTSTSGEGGRIALKVSPKDAHVCKIQQHYLTYSKKLS